MHRHLLKLVGVNGATVANRAIDAAKKTPKPPIAAKTVRAPK
jgi:hypothetical protein